MIKNKIFYPFYIVVLLGLWLIMPQQSNAQPAPLMQEDVPYEFFSGFYSGVGAEKQSVSEDISYPGVPWLRVFFGECHLGAKSYLVVTSHLDGHQQILNTEMLANWDYTSAYFNGDIVTLELVIAPGDEDIFYTIESLVIGEWAEGDTGSIQIESICGTTDNRTASTDNRGGRLMPVGCTAWLIANNGVLTAGHCVDLDPDATANSCGPLVPDGVLDMTNTWVVEFNVPASLANGTSVAAAPEDQYPVDTTNAVWNYDGCGQGLGKDWAIFGLSPNATSGTDPHIRFGFWRVSDANPAASDTIRITGFGVDDQPTGTTGGRNAQNQTNQTHTGPYVDQITGNVAGDLILRYQADSRGGNSGSPIIWTTTNPDFTVGIHTNAGCGGTDATPTGSNQGTSFEVNVLEAAIAAFPPGTNEEYVDTINYPLDGGSLEFGSVYHPWNDIAEGVNGVFSGGTLVIVEGTYNIPATVNMGTDGKSFTVLAPVGSVTIQ